MFRHVPLRVGMFMYLSVRFGTFRYVLIKIRTFYTKTYQTVPNRIELYVNLLRRTVTYSYIHVQTKMNGNTCMYQMNVSICNYFCTETYRNVPKRTLSENFHIYRYTMCVFGNVKCKHNISIYMEVF